jgi:hypothetical protein
VRPAAVGVTPRSPGPAAALDIAVEHVGGCLTNVSPTATW